MAAAFTNQATAETPEILKLDHYCSFGNDSMDPEGVLSFSSTNEAVKIINDIVDASGLAPNFVIRSGGVPNAAAGIRGNTRYIIYNIGFIKSLRESSGSDWAPISVLAHEVAHHLNAHTLDNMGSRPAIELEADYFSGFVLQKMGATLEEAQSAMQVFGSDVGSPTHPKRSDRLASIASGWSNACDRDNSCSVFTGDQPPVVVIPQTLPREMSQNAQDVGPESDSSARTYGAIAISTQGNDLYWVQSDNWSTRDGAEGSVEAACHRKFDNQCEIVRSFYNSCYSLVIGDDDFVVGRGSPTRAGSRTKALSDCRNKYSVCEEETTFCSWGYN